MTRLATIETLILTFSVAHVILPTVASQNVAQDWATSSAMPLQVYFPKGPARNAIRNLHPNEAEIELLLLGQEYVDNVTAVWRSTDEEAVLKFDWRREGVVLPVKDMKDCSASYAFSVVAILESQYKIVHGELKPFSVQQLVDCCTQASQGNYGCAGGRASTAFSCIQGLAGLQTQRDYPWQGQQGQCHFYRPQAELQVKAVHALNGEETIRYFVWKRGPVAAYLNPALLINDYPGGIIRHSDACDTRVSYLTHMVVIVGFGQSPAAVKYWIVRNSWGPRWGYAGYFHIERGLNTCGIETLAFIADIE